jgi:transcriptional regulator with XRE-family HTH domain
MQNTHTVEYKAFLKRLVAARRAAELTQDEVADLLAWPQSRISRMESGERRVDVIELKNLARVYERPIAYFLAKGG